MNRRGLLSKLFAVSAAAELDFKTAKAEPKPPTAPSYDDLAKRLSELEAKVVTTSGTIDGSIECLFPGLKEGGAIILTSPEIQAAIEAEKAERAKQPPHEPGTFVFCEMYKRPTITIRF